MGRFPRLPHPSASSHRARHYRRRSMSDSRTLCNAHADGEPLEVSLCLRRIADLRPMAANREFLDLINQPPCWSGKVDPMPLLGGITNKNYLVTDRRQKFVVRLGED